MFSLKEIYPQVYLWSFKNQTDLALHFVRYQEYYENPDSSFRSQPFEMMDFIGHYAKKKKGNFTYMNDWVGFNLPSGVLEAIYKTRIPDFNSYDYLMKSVYVSLKRENKDVPFYLIGCKEGDEDTVSHELAHALYYVNEEYREDMDGLIHSLIIDNENIYDKVYEALLSNYYTEDVVQDEMQAYFSTGLSKFLTKPLGKNAKKICKPFEDVFKKHTKKQK